jgi:tetratricopeptide (TPR) repeat protein
MAVPLAARVVQVEADLGAEASPRWRYGSGCIVAARTVLTAGHVVAGAQQLTVKDRDKRASTASLAFLGLPGGPDLALIEIDDPAALGMDPGGLPGMSLARIDRDSETAEEVGPCHAFGYPAFTQTASADGVKRRDTVDAIGTVPVLSHLARGLLSVLVTQRPRPLPDEQYALGQSEWSGMSGGPVVVDGMLLGVVDEHAPREGSSAITAIPLTALEPDPAHPGWGAGVSDPSAWWARLGVTGVTGLTLVPRPTDRHSDIIIQYGTGPVQAVSPEQLPPVTTHFTNRAEAVAALKQALAEGVAHPETIGLPVVAISGTPGVGKTATAVQLAYRMRADFIDGQLFVDLRAGDIQPLRPEAVLAEFLRALGVTGPDIPANLDDRARLYRAKLAGRRILVVLDNAAGEAQLRPLMPGGAPCAVIVTSRTTLGLLDARSTLALRPLSTAQAVELLAKVIGQDRVRGDPGTAERIASLCGGLPLALRIAAARLVMRSHWPLTRLADRLEDERGRLEELRVGDQEVRAGFLLAYQGLDEQARLAFRLLGLHHGVDFGSWLAGAMLDTTLGQAEDILDRLVDAQLLEAQAGIYSDEIRYRFHDLLRAFARERLSGETPEGDRQTALLRALSTAFTMAAYADRRISAGNSQVQSGEHRWQLSVPADDYLRCMDQPMRWFAAERTTLLELVRQAHEAELWPWAWLLASAMFQFFERGSRWDDWRSSYTLAMTSAAQAGDRVAEAACIRILGRLALEQGRMRNAAQAFEDSLARFRDAGDIRGASLSLRDLAIVARVGNRHDDAIRLLQEALAGFDRLGDRFLAAAVLRELAIEHRYLGSWDAALDAFGKSQQIFTELGELRQEAQGWFEMGVLERARRNWPAALEYLNRCLPILQEQGDRKWEAHTLREIGVVLRHQEMLENALEELVRCLEIFDDLKDIRQWAVTLHEIAVIHHLHGDLNDALTEGQRSIEIFREYGDEIFEARGLVFLGVVYADSGKPTEAVQCFQRSLPVLRAHGDRQWEAWALKRLADAQAGRVEAVPATISKIASASILDEVTPDEGQHETSGLPT